MADRAAPPFPTSATPPLVGRGREQAVLRDALAAALAGCGSLVLIGGEAGIGKTALAELVLAEAGARGATVLVGRCYDLSETPPYGPWAEALARAPSGEALPTLPAAVVHAERDGAAAGQDAIVRRVLAYLAALAETRPLVILLEDLHWADPASLDLLRVVGRGVADRALLLLATYRAAEQPPDHPLARLLPALVREARAARLDLGPLDAAAIGALVASRYALADVDRDRLVGFLAGRTEGNALFLGELVRTLEQVGALSRAHDRWALGDLARVPVPALLRQVIAGRLARLGDEDRRLLAVAAVIGQEVPFDVWATVGEAGEGALLDTAERAIAARVLEATQAGVRFAHALIRESLYEGVLAPRRRAWHRRAGEALLATPHPDPDAVASHLRRAGDPRAAEWLRRAGDHARRAYAMQTAAARYGAALGLLEDGMSAERAWLLLRLADVRRFTDVHLALAHLAAAQGAIRLVAEPLLGALCRLLSGRLHCQMGLVERGVRELAAGVALLDALSPEQREQAARAPTHWRHLADGGDDGPGNLMLWQAIAGRYAAARALGGRVRALADIRLAAGAAYATSPGDSCLGLGIACAALGDPAGARRAFREALAHYRAAGNHNMVAGALNTQLQFLTWPYDAEDPPERARLVAALETPVGRAGEAIDAPVAAMMGSTLLLEGRWDELRRAGETPFLWTETGQHHLLAPWAHRLALVGETARAWAAIRQFLPQGAATPPGESFFPVATGLQRLAVALALDADDLPAAREWLGRTTAGSPGARRCSGRARGGRCGRATTGGRARPRPPGSTPNTPWPWPWPRASRSPSSPPTACSARSTPARVTTPPPPHIWPPPWLWRRRAGRPTSAP